MKKEDLGQSYAGNGIYRENILDHYKSPHNRGCIENADIKHTESNPLCGDVITINVNLADHKIKDVKFMGTGCAISQAAASMLTDEIKGKSLEEAKDIGREFVTSLLGIEVGPVRIKCAALILVALKEGIKKFESAAKNGKIQNHI